MTPASGNSDVSPNTTPQGDGSGKVLREGWELGAFGDYVLSREPRARVRVIDTTIIGLYDTKVVTTYDTSGVQPHKVEVVMREVEKAVPLPGNSGVSPDTTPQQDAPAVGQVWASNHHGDRCEGERQHREVVRLDDRYAYLVTVNANGVRKPVTRVLRTGAGGITGHRRLS